MSPAGDKTPLRDRILAGALQVVREKGVVAATTKEIARAAGISEALVFKYFLLDIFCRADYVSLY